MKEGLPMGLPSSGLIADTYVDHVETQIMLLPHSENIVIWKRYVDDIFCLWSGTNAELEEFYEEINSKYKIKFNIEHAIANSLNFSDLSITLKDDNVFLFDIYRKPTQTNTIIPFSSYRALTVKRAAFRFLFHRLLNTPLTPENYRKELDIIYQMGRENEYSRSYIDEILTSMKRKIIPDKIYPHTPIRKYFISTPYYKDLHEKLKHTLEKYNYTLTTKRHRTITDILIDNKME